jgi:hypothetical protein
MDRRLPLVRCLGGWCWLLGAVALIDKFASCFLRDGLNVSNSRCTQYA